MPAGVQAVVGVPVYENVAHLRSALESLLAQDHPSFAVVVVDDSVSNEPGEIVREYERSDPRLRYERNAARLGLIANWRRAFALARELHPEAHYFAWGSDHDLWEPGWLSALTRELATHPAAVLAYPLNDVIDPRGEPLLGPWRFDTRGERTAARFVRVLRRMVAGDMAYGVFRADVLARCGPLRDVVFPDRLLLAELALRGEFRQVPQLLWHRRRLRDLDPSPAGRHAALFSGRPPRSSRLPWWIAHAGMLARRLALQGQGRPETGRLRGAAATTLYLGLAPALHVARRVYYAAGGAPRVLRPGDPPCGGRPGRQSGG